MQLAPEIGLLSDHNSSTEIGLTNAILVLLLKPVKQIRGRILVFLYNWTLRSPIAIFVT